MTTGLPIVVLGATGRTGVQLVEQALSSGRHERALVRDVARLDATDRLSVVAGDPLIAEDVARVSEGARVVLSVLGHRGAFNETQETRRRGAQALVQALGSRPGMRVVAVASAGVLPGPGGRLRGEVDLPDQYRTIFEDQRAMYRTLAGSALDWLMVCPPNVSSGPVTGTGVWASEGWPHGGGSSITTGELARRALAAEPQCVRVGVADLAS